MALTRDEPIGECVERAERTAARRARQIVRTGNLGELDRHGAYRTQGYDRRTTNVRDTATPTAVAVTLRSGGWVSAERRGRPASFWPVVRVRG